MLSELDIVVPLQLLIGMFSDGVNSLKELANQRKARASDLSGNTGARRVRQTQSKRYGAFQFSKTGNACLQCVHLTSPLSPWPDDITHSVHYCLIVLSLRCMLGIRKYTFLLFLALFFHSLECTVCCHSNCKCLNIGPLNGLIELDCDVALSSTFIDRLNCTFIGD